MRRSDVMVKASPNEGNERYNTKARKAFLFICLAFFLGLFSWIDVLIFDFIMHRGGEDGDFLLRSIKAEFILGFPGGLVCFALSDKMGLKKWRFLICGFCFWWVTLSFLIIYPFLMGGNKQKHYNYYGLALGLIFLVLYVASLIIKWFFAINSIGTGG